MIVRDEQHHLAGCLSSVRHVVDEIVVVDTGSVDATPDIADAFGAHVVHYPWQNDFSAARNVALDHARGRWILYIDADERLQPTTRSEVEQLLSDADEVAFRLLLRPFARSTPYFEYRLWRNDPRIRFRGVIHEKVVDAIGAVAAQDHRAIADCSLSLHHVGYDGDQTAKHRRNLPLLEAQLRIEQDNVYNWRHLARVLQGLGRTEEAERALLQAVEVARSHPGATDESLAWVDLINLRRDRGEEIRSLVAEARTRWPYNWMLVWVEGQLELEEARYPEAATLFRRLLGVDVSDLAASGLAYDERIFGCFAQSSLGLCCFRMGRYNEAAVAYRAAEALEPAEPEYRTKRLLCEALASRVPPGA
jgi:glycosyltransferase involved in cell wall biosynthesis